MIERLIFPPDVFEPRSAATLRRAVKKAIAKIGGGTASEMDRERLANFVIGLVRIGYSRSLDGSLDSDELADAALARFRSGAQ